MEDELKKAIAREVVGYYGRLFNACLDKMRVVVQPGQQEKDIVDILSKTYRKPLAFLDKDF